MKDIGKIARGALLLIAFIGLLPFFEYMAVISKKVPLFSSINTAKVTYISDKTQSAEIGDPVRILIPEIEIESTIEHRGTRPDGTMDIPERPEKVAWFKHGVRPGEVGSAVMAGHYGWITKNTAVFDNLHKLKVGDKIYVEDKNGIIISFVVREVKVYEPKADATEIFTSNDGKAHLNLITCDGFWSNLTQSYTQRRVVFSERE